MHKKIYYLEGVLLLIIVFSGFFIYFKMMNTPHGDSSAIFSNLSEQRSASSDASVVKVFSDTSSTISSSSDVKAPAINSKNNSSSSYKSVNQNGISASLPLPIQTIPSTTVPASSSGDNFLPPEMTINPLAIVGILCYFNTTLTDPRNGQTIQGEKEEVRGSGVIIDSRGYILTNRHVIKESEATTTATDNSNGNTVTLMVDYVLDHCEIGQISSDSHLPTPSEIQSLNPYIRIPVLGYTAMPVYISSEVGLSNLEIDAADFALLKVTGLTQAGPTFGVTSIPSSFPYVKLLAAGQYLASGTQVVTYGFPGDVTAGQGNSFETMTLTGSVGSVTEVYVGDKHYADTPLVIDTKMEVNHGRSGSPLFWRGYVVGLITFYIGDNRTNSGSVASDAILEALRSTEYNPSYN